MSRQHATPIHIPATGGSSAPLIPLGFQNSTEGVTEADLQNLIHCHPSALPIAEIDPMFTGAIPVCTELNTPAGPIDNFLVTPSGLPVLVECKLWRNPEARREVVGQILDYAKELSRWSSSDLHREVRRRLKRVGDPLLELVRAADPSVDEIAFNDALTANLRRGRFLLLVIGDGIREGVEAITEYLGAHAGLHFSLGLVELPVYVMSDGSRLVAPRVLARTLLVTRHVVAVPDGLAIEPEQDTTGQADVDSERDALSNAQQRFWAEFLKQLRLDDPEQQIPKPAKQGYLAFMLPAPGGSSWLTVYRDMKRNEVGVTLSSSRNSAGEYAMNAVVGDWSNIRLELGGTARIINMRDRVHVGDSYIVSSLDDPEARRQAFLWLAERVNTFVSVLRPRVRSAVSDYMAKKGE